MRTKILWVLGGVLISAILLIFLFPGKKDNQATLAQPVPAPGAEDVEELIVNTGEEGVEEESVEEIDIEGSEYSFSPASIRVRAGEKVSLTFKNTGSLSHDFVVDELGISTRILSPGQAETIEFVAETDDEVAFYCSIGGHRSLGLEGLLEVK